MQRPVNALRVLIKALVLFAIFNLLFAWLDPPVGKLTAYNWLWPGRVRFPYAESPEFYSLGYNVPVIEDFDAMFGAHILSAAPKPADEFRVFLLGDSSTWGGHDSPNEMLAAQINRLGLTACDGRKIKAYDLGYPWPSLLRDILILDRAEQYQPDMVIWMVTLHSFEKKPADREFLVPHAERMMQVVEEYHLALPKAYFRTFAPTFWERTIVGQRKRLKHLILNQVYGALWDATGIDNNFVGEHPLFSQDVSPDVSYFDYRSASEASALTRSLMFDALRVGYEMAGDTPFIVINEPIFIASGQNSNIRYNSLYPRWAYNAYRQALADWIQEKGYPYYDYWNALPAARFANDMFHRDAEGEAQFAGMLSPIVQKFSCP